MVHTIATRPPTQAERGDYDHVMEQLLVENQHETAANDEASSLRRRRNNNEENSHGDSTGNGHVDNVDNDEDLF